MPKTALFLGIFLMGILLVPGMVDEAWADVDLEIVSAYMVDSTVVLPNGETTVDSVLQVTVRNNGSETNACDARLTMDLINPDGSTMTNQSWNFFGLPPAAITLSSSPIETISNPEPRLARTFNTAKFELAFTA